MAERSAVPVLEIKGLNVYYGASHALQGVDLTLPHGVLSVVGRNGMGKTTLCKSIMGLVPSSSGSIRFAGQELRGLAPADVARLGIGYVPQGRRLWRSLTVDEHLKLSVGRKGPWSIDRIYSTFPRLGERKNNGGGQLSGGEQQMLAISRALLHNPRLLIMDEPTEGLAPVIVSQVAEMLVRLGEEGEVDVLVIEQNIGVATKVTETVAIMVNGRINRITDAAQLAGDRELQQRLLGVGRHGEETAQKDDAGKTSATDPPPASTLTKIYLSNPQTPTRWSIPVPVRILEQSARIQSGIVGRSQSDHIELRPLSPSGEPIVLVAGTLDTKGDEMRFIRDVLKSEGIAARLADLSTSGKHSGADIPAHQIAAFHPRGASGVFTSDRGQSVEGMTMAFERWLKSRGEIVGIISAAGSGGTAMVTPAMRSLAVGIPKVMISTIASGDVKRYVGAADIMMLHSVADIQGLNSITRSILANGAQALAGMVKARQQQGKQARADEKPAVGLTMFGVTTPCVQQITAQLKDDFDCLVFHATGIGGQSMEKLVDGGQIPAVIDITTTEIADMIAGGIFPATPDRFGAIIRKRIAYIGSVGALDMVNFGAPDSVPDRYRNRLFHRHNPQITLMRTTPAENNEIGRWIGAKLNEMEGPVRFFLPEGGVSALDRPGQAFHDKAADAALFRAIEETVRANTNRQVIRLPHHINDPAFSDEIVRTFRMLTGGGGRQKPGKARRS